jgi:hypothetical protein
MKEQKQWTYTTQAVNRNHKLETPRVNRRHEKVGAIIKESQ